MNLSRPVIIVLAAVAAAIVNLAIYVVGSASGVTFQFPDGTVIPFFVVAIFSAVPLAIALTLVALLAPRWSWVTRAALIAAPVVAVISIPLMPVPVGFDLPTTLALSAMHLVVGTAGLLGVLALRARLAAGAPAVTATAG